MTSRLLFSFDELPSTAARNDQTQRPAVDLLRILAAFFITWDHAFAPGWQYCDPALSVFLILTAYLSLNSYERDTSGGFWQKRVSRFLLPWLFWCAAFWILFRIIADQPEASLRPKDPFSLLVGPSIHLWFLPFCAVFLAVIPLASRVIRSRASLGLAVLALTAITLPLQWLHAQSSAPEPFSQWSLALPLFLFGVLHAIATRLEARHVTLVAALVISALSFALWPHFWALQMILGALLFEIAWRAPMQAQWPKTLSRYAFGIYLMHPAAALVVYKLFGADVDSVALALISFGGALLGTHVFLRLPLLRKTV